MTASASHAAKRRRRLLHASLYGFAALVLLCIASQAADPATITFSLDFPSSDPEHYSISVQSDGRAKYDKVEEVVDNLRAGGVDDVGLLTEQQLDNTLPPKPKKPGS